MHSKLKGTVNLHLRQDKALSAYSLFRYMDDIAEPKEFLYRLARIG